MTTHFLIVPNEQAEALRRAIDTLTYPQPVMGTNVGSGPWSTGVTTVECAVIPGADGTSAIAFTDRGLEAADGRSVDIDGVTVSVDLSGRVPELPENYVAVSEEV